MQGITQANRDFVLNKWVPALRSGKYKQGRGYLRNEVDGEVRHCCLGVAAEEAGIKIPKRKSALSSDHATSLGMDEWSDLELWGASNPDNLEPNYSQTYLAAMNDSGNYNFHQIADFIEERVRALPAAE